MDERVGSQASGRALEDTRNRFFGAGVIHDPYPSYDRLRDRCPVHVGSIAAQFPEMAGLFASGSGSGAFSTFRHDVTLEVLRNAEDFSSGPGYQVLADSIGPTMLSMDDPDHRRMHRLVQPAFSRREMERWKSVIIQPIVDEHLDSIVSLGRADIYSALGMAVPVHTISAAIGLPVADRAQFFQWAIAMSSVAVAADEKRAASDAVGEYVRPLIASRRHEPRDDLLSTLVRASVPEDDLADPDRPLCDDEIAGFVRLFIIAGASTTYRGFGSLMFHLLTNPDQLADVAANRSLISAAIHEALRMDQPLSFVQRAPMHNVELAGAMIPAGSLVDVSLGAANRDAEQFSDPNHFDIHREHVERQLGFGFGVHRCLGAHLAEAELTVMLDRCIDRLPNLRLDPDTPSPQMTGLLFRLPTGLPVLFDPA